MTNRNDYKMCVCELLRCTFWTKPLSLRKALLLFHTAEVLMESAMVRVTLSQMFLLKSLRRNENRHKCDNCWHAVKMKVDSIVQIMFELIWKSTFDCRLCDFGNYKHSLRHFRYLFWKSKVTWNYSGVFLWRKVIKAGDMSKKSLFGPHSISLCRETVKS